VRVKQTAERESRRGLQPRGAPFRVQPPSRLGDKVELNPPDWLDADFIFNVNYGPLTQRDFRIGFDLPFNFPLLDRNLIDEPVLERLYDTLYPGSEFPGPLRQLWLPYPGLNQSNSEYSHRRAMMIRAEMFVVGPVWNVDGHYGFGAADKPTLVAVILDMTDLVKFFTNKLEPSRGPNVATYIKTFHLRHGPKLRSSKYQSALGYPQGYLADIFATASGLRRVGCRPDPGSCTPFMYASLPGPDLVFPNHLKFTRASEPSADLTDLRASFIQSGPFKLKRTSDFHRHLKLTHDNDLFVFDITGRTDAKIIGDSPMPLDAYNGHAFAE